MFSLYQASLRAEDEADTETGDQPPAQLQREQEPPARVGTKTSQQKPGKSVSDPTRLAIDDRVVPLPASSVGSVGHRKRLASEVSRETHGSYNSGPSVRPGAQRVGGSSQSEFGDDQTLLWYDTGTTIGERPSDETTFVQHEAEVVPEDDIVVASAFSPEEEEEVRERKKQQEAELKKKLRRERASIYVVGLLLFIGVVVGATVGGILGTSNGRSNQNMAVVTPNTTQPFSPLPSSSPSLFPTPRPTPPQVPTPSPTTDPPFSFDPTSVPTRVSSSMPSGSPSSTSPVGVGVCSPFASIGAGAGTTNLSISYSDDATEIVNLTFPFLWRGEDEYNEIVVATNGVIWPGDNSTDDGCCDDFPIVEGGEFEVPRIAVAQTDVNPSRAGSIYASLADDGAFVVSWEGVVHYSAPSPENSFNFQAALYADGTVELRWGEGIFPAFRNITAGLEDDFEGVVVPATGFPFEFDGTTVQGEWPANQCRAFVPIEGGYVELLNQ